MLALSLFSSLQDRLLQVNPSARNYPLKWVTNARSRFCRIFILATAGIELEDRLMRSAMYRKDKKRKPTYPQSSSSTSHSIPMPTTQGEPSYLFNLPNYPPEPVGGRNAIYTLTPSYSEAPYFIQADALSGDMWYKLESTGGLNCRLIVKTVWQLETSYQYSIVYKNEFHNPDHSGDLQDLTGTPLHHRAPAASAEWATECYALLPILLICLIMDSPYIGTHIWRAQLHKGTNGDCPPPLTSDKVQIKIALHPSSVHLNRLLHMWDPTQPEYTHVQIDLTQSALKRYLDQGQCTNQCRMVRLV